ncbi:MAG: 3-deoxy-D-manno-octulosonic acid transferase [Pirellulaceae bacterium]
MWKNVIRSAVLNSIYALLLVIVSPFLLWAAWRTGKYRHGWSQKFLGFVPIRQSNRPCIWLHGVSVGEINLLAHLVEALQERYPEHEFVVSTTTVTGFELAQKKFPQLSTFYCPLDFSWAVKNAIRRLRPSVLVLGELEIWPQLISQCKQHQIAVAVVNGRLSEASFRGYCRLKWPLCSIFAKLDVVAAQSTEYARRFVHMGVPSQRVHVTGSMKFDGAVTDRTNPRTCQMNNLLQRSDHDIVFLAGSTQDPEEELAVRTFLELQPLYPALRLIVVPRHQERFDEAERSMQAAGALVVRRSQLKDSDALDRNAVLLVDTIGELNAWWGTADIAFVGGSLGKRGGQNMLEPAAYGAAVSFGTNTRNFRDIVHLLLQADAAQVVANDDELTSFVERCLQDESYRQKLGKRAQALVLENRGALGRTCDVLGPWIQCVDAAVDETVVWRKSA